MVDALLPEFDQEMTATRRVLERVPDDRLDWAPHAKSFSLGLLAAHVARLPHWGTETLARPDLHLDESPPPERPGSTSELLAVFDGHASALRAALEGRTDAELLAPWTLKQRGRTIFSMPKATVLRRFVLNHLIHHRGQLSVYLRLIDVPVPSIYGPSADEPAH